MTPDRRPPRDDPAVDRHNGPVLKILIAGVGVGLGLLGSFILGATYKQGLMDAHIRDGHPQFVMDRVTDAEAMLARQDERLEDIEESLEKIERILRAHDRNAGDGGGGGR